MPDIDTGEVRISYLDHGQGPAVILLHGGGPGATARTHFAKNLDALSQRYRVLAPDLPNFGGSGTLATGEPPSTMNARVIRDFLAAAGIERAHLIGYSFGASASIKLAADYPEWVDRLVLVDGGISLPSLFTPLPTQGTMAQQAFGREPSREHYEDNLRLALYDASLLDPELVERGWAAWQDRQQALGSAASPASPSSPAGPATPAIPTAPPPDNLFPDLPRILAPTLVIRGRDDRFAPLDQGLATIWHVADARLVVFGRCGHWVQYERAEEFHRVVVDFLDA